MPFLIVGAVGLVAGVWVGRKVSGLLPSGPGSVPLTLAGAGLSAYGAYRLYRDAVS